MLRMFEPENFEPKEAVDRFREIGVGEKLASHFIPCSAYSSWTRGIKAPARGHFSCPWD